LGILVSVEGWSLVKNVLNKLVLLHTSHRKSLKRPDTQDLPAICGRLVFAFMLCLLVRYLLKRVQCPPLTIWFLTQNMTSNFNLVVWNELQINNPKNTLAKNWLIWSVSFLQWIPSKDWQLSRLYNTAGWAMHLCKLKFLHKKKSQ